MIKEQDVRFFDKITGMRNMMHFRQSPIDFMMARADTNADIVHVPFAAAQKGFYLILNPDYVHDILVHHPDKLEKWARLKRVAGRVLGTGALAFMESDTWRRHRKLSTPAFHTQRIMQYVHMIDRHILNMMTNWDDGEVIDFENAVTEVTSGIIGEILFDIKDFSHNALGLHHAFEVLRRMLVIEMTSPIPIPDWMPIERKQREKKAIATIHRVVADLITERRKSGEDRGDILSALLQAVDEDTGERLSDAEIQDSLIGLFIPGHETTAILLTWISYHLGKNTDIQECLTQEIISVCGDSEITFDMLKPLEYMSQVIDEALRMHPPTWTLFMRSVVEPIHVGNDTIPKGGIVMMSPWVLHHQSRLWDNPNIFSPDRFSQGNASHHPYSFIPFGGGQRICIGRHLALMEVKVILSRILRKYRLELVDPTKTDAYIPRFTIHPVDGMPIRLHRRDTFDSEGT